MSYNKENLKSKNNLKLMAYYIRQYKKSVLELLEYTNSIPMFPAGSIVIKKNTVKKNGVKHEYYYKYIQTVKYKSGRKSFNYKYIPKSQVQEFETQMAERNKYKIKLQELKQNIKFWKNKLNIFQQMDIISFEMIDEEIKLQFKTEASINEHRINSFEKNKLIYKILTVRGDLVRSKNEAIVANCLAHHKINYYYEKSLRLKDHKQNNPQSRFIHPDFTVIINGNTYYIEVAGMMDDEVYNDNLKRKITEYELLGINLGIHLFCFVINEGTEINCMKLNDILIDLKNNTTPPGIVNLNI